MAIDFRTIQVGDKCKLVGAGAPGFANLGDTLEITKVEPNRVYAKRADGGEAFFALTCGAARLELLPVEHSKADEIGYALAKQIGSAHTISSNYGDIQLDDEMKSALQRAIRPILEKRYAALRHSTEA